MRVILGLEKIIKNRPKMMFFYLTELPINKIYNFNTLSHTEATAS